MVISWVPTYGEDYVCVCVRVCEGTGRSRGCLVFVLHVFVVFVLFFGSTSRYILSLSAWHISVCMSRQFGVLTSTRGRVCRRPPYALAFSGHFTSVETARTTEGQRSIGSHIHEWYECFASSSIYSLLPALHNLVIWCSSAGHSANRAFTQDCVLSFLTEIIFRSITLRMPSHLSNIKWL